MIIFLSPTKTETLPYEIFITTASNRGIPNRKKQIVSSIVVVALALFVTAVLWYGGLLSGNDEREAQLSGLDKDRLTVQFLDVGQGDSALLQTPNGSFVLIDTGPSDHRAELLGALRRAGVQTLSYMIFLIRMKIISEMLQRLRNRLMWNRYG